MKLRSNENNSFATIGRKFILLNFVLLEDRQTDMWMCYYGAIEYSRCDSGANSVKPTEID